jgi:hypothetical protein
LNRRQYTNAPIIAAVYFLLVLFPCFLWLHVGRFVILGVRPDFFALSVGIAVLIAPYLIMALFLALLIRIPNKRRSLNWFDKGVLLAGILAALFMARMGWVFVDSTQEIYVYASAKPAGARKARTPSPPNPLSMRWRGGNERSEWG